MQTLLVVVSTYAILGALSFVLGGAAPHYVDHAGQPALPAGTFIGLTLIMAFVLVYLHQGRRHRKHG